MAVELMIGQRVDGSGRLWIGVAESEGGAVDTQASLLDPGETMAVLSFPPRLAASIAMHLAQFVTDEDERAIVREEWGEEW